MGRRIPSEGNPFIHPTISLSLIAAWIAITIAIIAALCGVRSRKSSSRAPPSPTHKTGQKPHIETEVTTTTTTTPMQQTITTITTLLENPTERFIPQVQEQKQLPSTSKLKETQSHIISAMSTSKRKLSVSLSMKLGGRTLARYRARKEEQHEQQQQQQQQQLKPEDSIWMKTIILGERCRVPNEEDAIIYDGKGNRIAAYPPRMPRSLPVSRTNSLLDPDSLPY